VRISIITPSLRQSEWLKLCIASVADQQCDVEHIVQDAGSDDGTLDWVRDDPRVKAFVEKDSGMYDAINRGLRRATGEVLAYLNCDEQYLPGALIRVHEFFLRHPGVDMVFGDILFTNTEGSYLYHRKVQVPLLYHTWTWNLSTLSCAMFFRRRLISELGEFFDPRWRTVGDGEWMLRLLRRGVAMATLGQFTSAFTQTGANMSANPNAWREAQELLQTAPPLARTLRPLIRIHHRLRRLLGGMYFQRPFAYEIFTLKSPRQRTRFEVKAPRARGFNQSSG
jgi:glycosyltransferase involved in cell wall biosynthesis